MIGVLAPLGVVFRQARGTTPDADEILVLSFNHDLAFFEKAVLGPAQLMGARITIVADATMAHHDVYAVRRAGTAYLPGLAHCSGSFHPKLVVVTSKAQATVGIGSGNLSMAGWQGNDELWSWHHAGDGTGSAIVPDVGRWLRSLAATVSVSTPVADALRRVGDLLAGITAPDESCRLVETISGRILDQLPEGPVDELNLYAPFFDQNATAVGAIVQRLEPAVVRVGYQPTMTRINGAAVARLLGPASQILELPQDRYRHGKLIEWAVAGRRWALTGSANISAAALLRTVSDGGNVELGVVAPISDSLMPAGVAATESHFAAVEYRGMRPASGPPTVILAATRSPAGVELEFLSALRDAGRIEMSDAGWAPDGWEPVAEVVPGQPHATVRDAPGGSRVRVRFTDGICSAVAWVTDLTRVQRTRSAVRSGPSPPELGDVFSDVAAAEKFFQLSLERQKVTVSRATSSGGSEASRGEPATVETWEEYLDRCADRVGPYTFAFSFGLPLPSRHDAHPVSVRVTDWDDDTLDDGTEGLEGDTAEDTILDEDRGLTVPQLTKAQDKVRARYRAVARRMVHDWVSPEPQERLLGLRSTLLLVSGGAWDHTDNDWRPLVLDGVERLPVEHAGPDYSEASGSLGLLALSIVRSTLSTREPGLVESRFERTVQRVADLVVEASPDRLAEYADGLSRRFPGATHPAVAMIIIDRLTADPLANARDDIADLGIDVRLHGRVLDLTKRVPDPLLGALWALSAAEAAAPVAVRCASSDNRFVNVLWHPPHLVVIDSLRPGTYLTRHYRYAPRHRPGADIRLQSRLDPDRCVASTSVKDPLPDLVTELLEELGLPGPAPPAG